MTRLALLALCAVAVGCGSTYFNVRVRDRRPTGWIEGASVALRSDATCSGGLLSLAETDAEGMAEVQARGCGPRVLWVSAEGFRPQVQDVDSCDDAQRNVVLMSRPPEPQLDTPEVTTARAFLAALDAQDREAVSALLAKPSELPQYLDRITRTRVHPCKRRLARVQSGSEPRVEFDALCENSGCEQTWSVVLTPRDGALRVRALELGHWK